MSVDNLPDGMNEPAGSPAPDPVLANASLEQKLVAVGMPPEAAQKLAAAGITTTEALRALTEAELAAFDLAADQVVALARLVDEQDTEADYRQWFAQRVLPHLNELVPDGEVAGSYRKLGTTFKNYLHAEAEGEGEWGREIGPRELMMREKRFPDLFGVGDSDGRLEYARLMAGGDPGGPTEGGQAEENSAE